MSRKEVIGAPLVIDGRVLSLSRAVRAGDFVFVTGQVPMRDGKPMTIRSTFPTNRQHGLPW
jgi:enamine deaminase RidA (YjgF/YER057c/UK114 family)